jgi:excisionase family DNA binding protein
MSTVTNQTSRTLPDPRECPTVTVEVAAAILGVSRGSAYEAVRNGTIASLRVGRRVLIPTAHLAALLGCAEFAPTAAAIGSGERHTAVRHSGTKEER